MACNAIFPENSSDTNSDYFDDDHSVSSSLLRILATFLLDKTSPTPYYYSMKPDKIIHLISRINNQANRFIIEELAKHGLKGLVPSHGDILMVLFMQGPLSMKELANKIDKKKTTVTTLIEKLEALGYVSREVDEDDKRFFLLSLTKEGRALKNKLISISDNLLDNVYKNMPQNDRKTLVKLLNQIHDRW